MYEIDFLIELFLILRYYIAMPNQWVTHVKNWASKNDMSYGCAISQPECKASYYKQKERNAKKTRTPEQEMEGMGAEDVNVAEKPKPKAKKLKPLTSEERARLKALRKQMESIPKNKYKDRKTQQMIAEAENELEGLAERESVAPKAVKAVLDNFDLLRKISGFVRKPIVFDEDEDLQALSYAYRALSTIEMIASDADIRISKAFKAHLEDRMELVNYNQYEKYANMTEDELQPMYDAEQDFELYEGTLESIADDYGMDIKFSDDGNYKLIRARLNKSRPKAILSWLHDFITEQEKSKSKKSK